MSRIARLRVLAVVWALTLVAGVVGEEGNSFCRHTLDLGQEEINSSSVEWSPTISPDGRILIFSSNRPGGVGGYDLYMTTRGARDEDFGAPVNLRSINSSGTDANSAISRDNLRLFIVANSRAGGFGGDDIWLASRLDEESEFGDIVNLGANVNTTNGEYMPCLSADELQLFFVSGRSGQYGDIYVSTRSSVEESFGRGMHLGHEYLPGSEVNSQWREREPFLAANGLALFLSDGSSEPFRPGGMGTADIWISTRDSTESPFGPPLNINEISLLPLNTTAFELGPTVTEDWPEVGSELYYISNWDLARATWGMVPTPHFTLDRVCDVLSPVDSTVEVNASGCTSPEPAPITSYQWDFGDGSTVELPAATPLTTHTYDSPGRYIIELTVLNSEGFTNVLSQPACIHCEGGDLGPWQSSNIGEPDYLGSARFEGEVLHLCAGGNNITGPDGQMLLVHQELSGNFRMTARVEVDEYHRYFDIGLMCREDLESDAACVATYVRILSSDFRFTMGRRAARGERSTRDAVGDVLETPAGWVRLERQRHQLTGLVSTDGETWVVAGREIIDLPETLRGGVFAVGRESLLTTSFTPLQARVSSLQVEDLPLVPAFVRGDCNGDGQVKGDVSDAVYLLQYNFLGGQTPPCLAACDVDGSGQVSGETTDAISLLSYNFLGGPPPALPYPGCGLLTDELDVALGCMVSTQGCE